VKLELYEHRAQPAVIRRRQPHRIEIERDVEVLANGHELFRQAREIDLLEQRLARALLRNLRSVRNDVLEIPKRVHELLRTLLPNALYAGNVVRRIAEKREIVGHQRGRHTEALAGVFDADPLFFDARWSAAPRVEQPHAGADELLEVLVTRYDDDVDARLDRLPCERADHVVRFISL
jgi:hypothetical protein